MSPPVDEKGDYDDLEVLTNKNLEMQDKLERVETEMKELREKMMQMHVAIRTPPQNEETDLDTNAHEVSGDNGSCLIS